MEENNIFNSIYDDSKLLTIVIPTYNREERLMNQLKSIFLQPEYKKVEIVILDNHSNYNIQDSLKRNFLPEELSSVELVKNPFNIGIDGNLSNSFMFCKTKYMWLLSDDDETLSDSIKKIISNIENYKDIAIFKYSINNFKPEEDKTITNFSEFINYYKSGIHTSGAMIFISNNIFNMELLKSLIQNVFTPFSFIMLMVTSLASNVIKMQFCSQSIVNYIPPNPGSEWDFISMLLRMSTFDKFLLSILYKENYTFTKWQIRKLSTLIVRDFSHKKLLVDLFKISSSWKRSHIYNKLFFDVLIHGAGCPWIYFFSFHFLNLINIDYSALSHIIKKAKNILVRLRFTKFYSYIRKFRGR